MIHVPPKTFYGEMRFRTVAQRVVRDLSEANRSTKDELLMELRQEPPTAPFPSDPEKYVTSIFGADPELFPLAVDALEEVQEEWTLKEEGGVTRWSLHNARSLIWAHGVPDTVGLYQDERGDWVVEARWPRLSHRFLGLSWGYSGEGPRGLEELFEMLGADPLISMKEIEKSVVRTRVPKEKKYHFQGPREWEPAWKGKVYVKGVDYGKD